MFSEKIYLRNRPAFTLAEVLVTLAVIGVVAALIIPPLAKSYQDMVIKSSYKKAYSTLNNLYRLAISDNGGANYFCSHINRHPNSEYRVGCPDLWNAMKDNVKTLNECNWKDGNNFGKCIASGGILMPDGSVMGGGDCGGLGALARQQNNPSLLLANGQSIFMFADDTEIWPIFVVDVNGLKGPNHWGSDAFAFLIDNNKLEIYTCSGKIPGAEEILLNNN